MCPGFATQGAGVALGTGVFEPADDAGAVEDVWASLDFGDVLRHFMEIFLADCSHGLRGRGQNLGWKEVIADEVCTLW